jgi:hypothetical protein
MAIGNWGDHSSEVVAGEIGGFLAQECVRSIAPRFFACGLRMTPSLVISVGVTLGVNPALIARCSLWKVAKVLKVLKVLNF